MSKPIPPQCCLACAKPITRATGARRGEPEVAPEPGDVSICLKCSAIAVYDEELILRAPTEDEESVISRDPDVVRALQILEKVRRMRAPRERLRN